MNVTMFLLLLSDDLLERGYMITRLRLPIPSPILVDSDDEVSRNWLILAVLSVSSRLAIKPPHQFFLWSFGNSVSCSSTRITIVESLGALSIFTYALLRERWGIKISLQVKRSFTSSFPIPQSRALCIPLIQEWLFISLINISSAQDNFLSW